jgi:hypothetical protein
MKFLVFNLIVVGALGYLFTADRGDIRSVADTAHAAVERVESLAVDTVDKVNGFVGKETARPAPEPVDVAVLDEPAAEPVEEATRPRQLTPRAETAEPPVVVENEPSPKPDTAKPNTDATEKPVRRAPVALANNDVPARWIPPRPVHAPPAGGSGTGTALAPIDDPAVAKRRAEILSPETAPAQAAKPASTPEKIAIAEGEKLMSPSERRRELYALAQEMELLFLRNAGQ